MAIRGSLSFSPQATESTSIHSCISHFRTTQSRDMEGGSNGFQIGLMSTSSLEARIHHSSRLRESGALVKRQMHSQILMALVATALSCVVLAGPDITQKSYDSVRIVSPQSKELSRSAD